MEATEMKEIAELLALSWILLPFVVTALLSCIAFSLSDQRKKLKKIYTILKKQEQEPKTTE